MRSSDDVAASEVIAYTFMLALGAVALTLAMNVMTDTQEDANRIAAGAQLKQVAEIVAGHIQEAARVAVVAPNATYEMSFEIPESIGRFPYNGTIKAVNCNDPSGGWVVVSNQEVQLDANVSLGNAGLVEVDSVCLLDEDVTFHSSAGCLKISYDGTSADPEIAITTDR